MRKTTHMASLRLVEQSVGLAYSPLGHQYKRGYRAEKGRTSSFISFGDDSKRSTSAHWVEQLLARMQQLHRQMKARYGVIKL